MWIFFYKIDNPKEFSLLIQGTFECSKEGIYPHIKNNLGGKVRVFSMRIKSTLAKLDKQLFDAGFI